MDPFPDESMKDLKIPRGAPLRGHASSDEQPQPVSTMLHNDEKDLERLLPPAKRPVDSSNSPFSSPSVYMDHEETECIQSSPDDCMADMRSPRFSTEAWEIIRAATPLTAGFFADHFIEIIHLLFLGRLAADELAAAALALLYCNVTGLCIIMGIMNGIETMAAQALGARSYRRLGVILQRGLLIGALFMIPIAILRYYSSSILIFFGMDIDIAARASEFILIATLNIPALVIQEALRRYAQAIDRGDVTLYNTMCGLLLTPVFNYVFVMRMGMGCLGVAWSVVITSYIMTVQLLLYYRYTSVSLFPHTHFTPTTAAFNGWPAYLRLALPGTLSLAAEWVGLEAQSLVAAKQGVAALGAQSIMFNLTLQLFMPSMALGMVASARVGRYLGANQPNAAKFAAKVAITLSFVSMAAMGTIVLLCGRGVGKAFTSDPGVLRAMELCIPLLVLYCLFDGLQGVGVGVMRGCGMQGIAFRINLVAYWFVALPLAYAFALRLGTHTDLDVFYDADTAGQIVAVPGWGLQGQWAAMAMTSAGVCLAVMGTLLWGMDWNKKSKEIVENEKRELERENALIQALKAEDGDGDEDEDEEIGLMRRPEPGYGSINE